MIYFLKVLIPDGPIKIGFSQNTQGCKKRLEGFSLPWPVKFLAIVNGTMGNEKWAHTELAKHRLNREWFSAAPEVLSFIERVSASDWVWPKTPERKVRPAKAIRIYELPWPIPSARQLNAIRVWLGLSQSEFGDKAGVSLATINNYEGELVKPSLESKIVIGRFISQLGIKFNDKGAVELEQ